MLQIVSRYKKQGKGDDPAPDDKITTTDGKVGIAKEAKKQPGHRAVEPGEKPARPAASKQKDATRKVSRDGSRSGDKAKPGKKRLVKKARIMETDVSNGSKKRAMEELPDEDSELEDRVHRKESRCRHLTVQQSSTSIQLYCFDWVFFSVLFHFS